MGASAAKVKADRNGVIRVLCPENRSYYTVNDVMALLGVKETKAYDLMNKCRQELIESNQLISDYPRGRVPKRYFNQRCAIDD